jgi:hypothetical protein
VPTYLLKGVCSRIHSQKLAIWKTELDSTSGVAKVCPPSKYGQSHYSISFSEAMKVQQLTNLDEKIHYTITQECRK